MPLVGAADPSERPLNYPAKGNYNAFRNCLNRRLRPVFTLRVYAPLTAGNADVYAPRNAVVCRELRQLDLPAAEKEEGVYADCFPDRRICLRSGGLCLRLALRSASELLFT